MENILVDNTQYLIKLGETLELGFNLIERGTWNIYNEINKIREDYLTVINKFLENCEREGLRINCFGDNYSRTLLDKDKDISFNTKQQCEKNLSKYYKLPLNDLPALKVDKESTVDKKDIKNNSSNPIPSLLHPGNNSPVKSGLKITSPPNAFSYILNNTKSDTNSRIHTPTSQKTTQYNKGKGEYENINASNPKFQNRPSFSELKTNDQEELNKSGILSHINTSRNLKTGVGKQEVIPKNKKGLQKFVISNPNNNYTKKFILKQSIENLSNTTDQTKKISKTEKIKLKSSTERTNLSHIIEKKQNPNIELSQKIDSNDVIDDLENKEDKINIVSNINFLLDTNSIINKKTTNEFKNNNRLNNNTNTTDTTNTNNTHNNANINNFNVNFGINNMNNLLVNNNNKIIDERKFSILDIAGGPLINESEIEEMKKNTVCIISNASNRKSELSKSLLGKLAGNKLKVLYLMAYSDIPPIKMRMKFSKINKLIYSEYSSRKVLQDSMFFINDKIIEVERYLSYYLSNPENERLINSEFNPSKTALNCLNFITKEDERNLMKENCESDVNSIFKFVFILLKHNFEKFEHSSYKSPVDYLLNTLFTKMKLDSIKSLFLNVICHNLQISNDQYSNIIDLVENNKTIINPGIIIKGNKILVYIKFILKEIYEYLTMKTDDGVLLLNLRKQKHELKKLKDKFIKINTFLAK